MENKQQTAVDWLYKELDNILELYPSEWEKVSNAIQQAKEIEKDHIRYAFIEGYKKSDEPLNHDLIDKYYNETYGQDNKGNA